MLHQTRGIVLKSTAYKESSVIVKAYTELFGLQSYIVNGVRKNNAKIRNSYFQPLTLLDMTVYHRSNGGLQRMAQVNPQPILFNIQQDVMASGMAMFINEVLYKTIREEEPNTSLFDFIWHGVEILEYQKPVDNWFHIRFLFQLTKYLGFYPSGICNDVTPYFNLVEGTFVQKLPAHVHVLHEYESKLMAQLLQLPLGTLSDLSASAHFKKQLLSSLIDYYRLHHENFGELKSLDVLQSVWS